MGTMGGETHMIQMTGTMMWGLHDIVYLLRVLATDQLANFTCGSEAFGLVSMNNLDKQALIYRKFLDCLLKLFLPILVDTPWTVFVFVSLQFLVTHSVVRNVILNCVRRGTLWSITLNRAYLLVKYGASFRLEIRMPGDNLFAWLFGNISSRKQPWLVCMTANNSKKNCRRLEVIRCVTFPT